MKKVDGEQAGGVYEWEKGVLELVPCTVAHLCMEPAGGVGTPNVTTWDFKEAVKAVTQGVEPLFMDMAIGREKTEAKVGFRDAATADLMIETLDKRVVPMGKARLKVDARRYVESEEQWKAHFFKEESDATSAVQDELFKRAAPGQRPDTLVLHSLPCKWFGVRLDGAGDDDGAADGADDGATSSGRLMSLMQSLGWWVVAVEASRSGGRGAAAGMLYFDAYVQVRKLSELQAALALFRGKALRYVPSDKVVPLEVSVDTSGFMSEAAVVARREMQKVEAEARRAYKQRLQELSKDREEVEGAVKHLVEQSREGGVEEVEAVGKALGILEELLAKAKRAEAQAQGEGPSSWGSKLKDLASCLGQIKSHLPTGRRVVEESVEAVRETREREAQEKRAAAVREARVSRAKELKPIEDGWLVSLSSDRWKAASETGYGSEVVNTAQAALDAARELVLKKLEGPLSDEDVSEHAKKLKKAVKAAQAAVAKAEGALELQARTVELQTRLEKVLVEDGEEAGVKKEGGEEDQEEKEEVASWRWPFPRLLSEDEAYRESRRRADAALSTLDEVRSKLEDPQGERAKEALKELRFHVEKVLGPKRRRHRAVVPRAKQLDELVGRWQEVMAASEGVRRAAEAAETAVKRAYRGMGEGEGARQGAGDEELIEVMEAAIERMDTAAENVMARRREEEELKRKKEEEQKRKAEEAAREAEAREEAERARAAAEEQEKIVLLERRKAFLEDSLRIRKARHRLRLYRQHVMSRPPPAQRLLQAGGLQLQLKRKSTGGSEAEEGGEEEDDKSAKLTVVTPVPILTRWRPWAAREPVVEESAANQVSGYYWDELHDKEQEVAAKEAAEFKYPAELRLKTVVVKVSEDEEAAAKRRRKDSDQDDAQSLPAQRLRGAAVVVSTAESEEPRRRRGAVVVVDN